MIVVVRLYRQHDLDLLTLYFNDNIKLGTLMKKTVLAYANGDSVPGMDFGEPENTNGYMPKSACFHIKFNENKESEKEAVKLLKCIKPGYRCSFVKALFRNSSAYLPMVAYTNGSDFKMSKLKAYVATDISKNEEPVNQTFKPEPVVEKPAPVIKVDPEKEYGKVEDYVKPVEEIEEKSDEVDLDAMFESFSKMR